MKIHTWILKGLVKKKKKANYLNNFFKDFIYLFMRDTEREAETQAEGEEGSMHREPDVGFDPRSPGSRPRPKAAPNRCATQGSLMFIFKLKILIVAFPQTTISAKYRNVGWHFCS